MVHLILKRRDTIIPDFIQYGEDFGAFFILYLSKKLYWGNV